MILLIDSNVWISALVYGGKPREIFEYIVKNGMFVAVSDEMISEVRRILRNKFPLFLDDFEAILALLSPYCRSYKLGTNPVDICRDPDDNYLLELGNLSKANFIISGDKDLLSIGVFNNIPITTPADFVAKNIKK